MYLRLASVILLDEEPWVKWCFESGSITLIIVRVSFPVNLIFWLMKLTTVLLLKSKENNSPEPYLGGAVDLYWSCKKTNRPLSYVLHSFCDETQERKFSKERLNSLAWDEHSSMTANLIGQIRKSNHAQLHISTMSYFHNRERENLTGCIPMYLKFFATQK